MELQFGTNWSHFSRFAGGVIGQTLRMEGMFAFFLESAVEKTLELEQSTFELAPLPPGRYVLGAYVVKKIIVPPNGHTYANEGPIYFPGETGIAGAEPFDVAEGKSITNVKLKIMY